MSTLSRELKLTAEANLKTLKALARIDSELISYSETVRVKFYYKTIECEGVFLENNLIEIHWLTPKASGKIKYKKG